jgi:transposase
LVQALKITVARLKKQRFGASSEKIEREIEQLELALESLETARAAADPTPEADTPEAGDAPAAETPAPAAVPQQRRRGKPRIAATRRARPSCSPRASAAPIAAACCGWWARTSPRSS